MEDFTDEELIEFYKKFDSLKKKFKEDKQYGFDLEADKFFLRVRPLKTQIYGLRVQCYFAYHMDFTITPSSLDTGDFRTKANHDIEFKCSFLDEESNSINVKQIRNWQDLDYYYIFTVDYKNYSSIEYKCYELSKEQMIEECKIMNAKPVANVKDKNNTEHASLGFSIQVGSEHFKRWEKKYLNKKFDIKKIVINSLSKINNLKQKEEEIKRQQEYIRILEAKIKELSNKENEIIYNLKENKEEINEYEVFHSIEVTLEHWKAKHR